MDMNSVKTDLDSDMEQNYSLNSNNDPKNMQELTVYVRNKIFHLCFFSCELCKFSDLCLINCFLGFPSFYVAIFLFQDNGGVFRWNHLVFFGSLHLFGLRPFYSWN